ncbi:type II secretion system protein GspL [Flagellatimonas centrodinii]|uniref:type II secretion system protein GspL n=1 Tax=Flagellatimonas centrodinii TaxID=2806210 RepID=UPI001FED382A|nr:type II secretion system protein GspL [Flagellatimonas centrodinii]ULQ46246.1 type II secretion system protein GspL [Flagellatimonas centrodinii]
MRETLYLRLRSTDADAATEYCVAPEDARLSWPVERAPLRDVLRQAAGRHVVVLVPGDDVRLERLALPVKQAAKAALAAPFALEESLADEVDTLHFAVGNRQTDGSFPVAVARLSLMEGWLAPLRAAGIRPKALIAETLCLPMPDDQWWYGLVEGDRVLVRHQPWASFSSYAEDLPLLLDLADGERRKGLRLIVSTAAPDFTPLERSIELRSGFRYGLEALLPQLAESEPLNLLQGRYSQQADYQRLWRPWRVPAALTASLLALVVAEYGVATWRLGHQAAAQDARNVTRFQQLFPGETRIVDLGAQAEQQLQLASQRQRGGGLLPLTAVLEQALRAVDGLQLQGLQYREGAVFASLTGNALAQLEALRGQFANRGDVTLEVQSANSGSDGVQIRIRIAPV